MTLDARRHTSGETDLITFRYCYGPTTIEIDEQRGHALQFWHELGKLVTDNTEDRAKAGWQRYVEAHPKDEMPMPAWEALSGEERGCWIAAFTE
jgi:hypothetical protein